MNRKQKSLVILVSATMVVLVVTAATVTAWTANTPLYMFRMEQASSKMNFLPTAINCFDYTTEKGYTLNCNIGRYCNNMGVLYDTGYSTCPDETCEHCLTYPPGVTCPNTSCATCASTCPNTCKSTCPNTCKSTCPNTCPYTCPNTCATCPATCATCDYTCCVNTICLNPSVSPYC